VEAPAATLLDELAENLAADAGTGRVDPMAAGPVLHRRPCPLRQEGVHPGALDANPEHLLGLGEHQEGHGRADGPPRGGDIVRPQEQGNGHRRRSTTTEIRNSAQ
jgi:hypothetical protein